MSDSHHLTATLWEYIMPMERGDRYEDPLDEALSQHDLGGVSGGGSQLSDDCGIEFVDIEITLNDLERGIPVIVATLEANGAPKGSRLRHDQGADRQTLEFGVTECLAVFLDGVGLPDEVYQTNDINVLIEQLAEILSGDGLGELRSWWQGPKETALFYFGEDAERMFQAMRPPLENFPLSQNARMVIRHGKPELNPRIVRLGSST